MTDCLDCTNFLSVEDLLRQVIVCNDSGQVAFKANIVDESTDKIIQENSFYILQEDSFYILIE